MPGSVVPAGVVTVIAMPPRPVAGAAGARRTGAGAGVAGCPVAGGAGFGACGAGCPVGGGVAGLAVCGGDAGGRGCAGACCPAAATNTPEATTQLMSSVIFMPLITAENVPPARCSETGAAGLRARATACAPYNPGGRQGYPIRAGLRQTLGT